MDCLGDQSQSERREVVTRSFRPPVYHFAFPALHGRFTYSNHTRTTMEATVAFSNKETEALADVLCALREESRGHLGFYEGDPEDVFASMFLTLMSINEDSGVRLASIDHPLRYDLSRAWYCGLSKRLVTEAHFTSDIMWEEILAAFEAEV